MVLPRDPARQIPRGHGSGKTIALSQIAAQLQQQGAQAFACLVLAIVQVGTNLSMVKLAAMAELWLGKPVIAINTATYWHALRAVGIHDKKAGMGSLMEIH